MRSSALELIAERACNDSRPERRLRSDELLRADESAGVRVGEVLAGEREAPGVLRDPDCCVVGRVGRVLEPSSRGAHGSAQVEGRIRTRLCEGMRSMKSSCLNEWNVTIDVPLVAGVHAEL